MDTISTSSSMLDTSHDSNYDRKISSISVHDTLQTPKHKNSFITPNPVKNKISLNFPPPIYEDAIKDEKIEKEQKPKKGPAPPPPQYSPPAKRPKSVGETRESRVADGDHLDNVTPVKENCSVLSVNGDVTYSETPENGSVGAETNTDDEDDLSPEKERVLQMLDSVIQEQEESCILTDEEPDERPASSISQHSPDPDEAQICLSSSSAASESSSTASASSPVSSPPSSVQAETPEKTEKLSLLSPRPTSISPGASRPETPKSSKSSSIALASPRSLSSSPSPSPSMDRPSPDGSSTGGSPLPPWPKSRSPSPKNNVEVTVIGLSQSTLDSETPAAPPSSLTHQQSSSPPPPATPDRHVSVIVVGNHQDYKVQDSSSLGSSSPQVPQTEQESRTDFITDSLSPPPGFDSRSSPSDHESLSSMASEDGRKSANSKKSGTSLMIEGTTTEETSTDLSIDLGNTNTVISLESAESNETTENVESDKETEPEEPIIPVLKSEVPKKTSSSESRRQEKDQSSAVKKQAETNKKVVKERREKPVRSGQEDRAKLDRQEEERRIAQEVREGRERYDRRSQDRLDDIKVRPSLEKPVEKTAKEERAVAKESGLQSEQKTSKRDAEMNGRPGGKITGKENSKDSHIPDLVLKNVSPVKSSGVKPEHYKKAGRSTSEASVLQPVNNTSVYLNDSDSEEVILRKPKAKADPEEKAVEPEIGSAVTRNKPLTKEDIQKMNLKKKTRKRTRKFEIDGVTVTTTTSKVIYRDEDNQTFYDEHYFRKQELRELKMLQKQEQKQFQDLAFKNQLYSEQQEKRFDSERVTLMKNYENDLTSMVDSQKKQVDKCESQQQDESKVSSKRIRNEQEKELKTFRESLKQETKLLKHEVELLPKDRRKEALKIRKEQLEREHVDRERCFVERLNETHENHMKRLSDTHREKIALLDRQFLQQKQQLMRAREAALWEMEERQLHERHQLAKRQLKDMFFLQRHQMLVHHEKELDHLKRMMERKEEELVRNQAVERRALPKRIRAEMKAREMMFR